MFAGLFWLVPKIKHPGLGSKCTHGSGQQFPPSFLGAIPPTRCFFHVFDLPTKAVKIQGWGSFSSLYPTNAAELLKEGQKKGIFALKWLLFALRKLFPSLRELQ